MQFSSRISTPHIGHAGVPMCGLRVSVYRSDNNLDDNSNDTSNDYSNNNSNDKGFKFTVIRFVFSEVRGIKMQNNKDNKEDWQGRVFKKNGEFGVHVPSSSFN